MGQGREDRALQSFLVVGGAGGVGAAVVDRLVSRGCAIEVTVLEAADAAWIQSRYQGRVKAHIVDLSDADATRERIGTIIGAMPSLDAVILCAAVSPCGPAELNPLEIYRRAFEINCVSAVSIYQAAMPALRKSAGRIVFLSSIAGKAAFPFLSAYVATKFALEGLCDSMRREAGPQGVKIIAIQPGAIRTSLVQQQIVDVNRSYAALGEEEQRRYGHFYQSFLKIAGANMAETASSPEQIAAVVIEALDAEEPATRYAAGADAGPVLEMARTLPDRQIDEMFARMFSS